MNDRKPYVTCNGSPVTLGGTFALFGDEHDDVMVLTTVGEIRDVYMTGRIDGYNEDWLGSEDHPVTGTALR